MKHLKEGLQNFLCTDFLWYITWCCILYAQKHRFFFNSRFSLSSFSFMRIFLFIFPKVFIWWFPMSHALNRYKSQSRQIRYLIDALYVVVGHSSSYLLCFRLRIYLVVPKEELWFSLRKLRWAVSLFIYNHGILTLLLYCVNY